MQAKKQKPNVNLQKPRLEAHKSLAEGKPEKYWFMTPENKNEELFKMALYGWTREVKILLDEGANPNARDSEFGMTALMKAAVQGHFAICKLLIERGADVNARSEKGDSKGSTALMCAASNGYIDICKLLIEHGADVNARNKKGWTALMHAGRWGRTDICKLLVENGADALAKDNANMTAHMIALEKGHDSAADFLKRMETIQQAVGRENLNAFLSNFRQCISGGV
jgi:ankyrin repeat protein